MKASLPFGAAVIAIVVAAASWHHVDAELRSFQARLDDAELKPIAALLEDDQKLLTDLQSPTFAEKDSGILESYLLRLRRDGVSKTAEMRQRLDSLAENNTAIATLINAYLPGAKTQGFMTEANKFRSYAAAWRDRWNSSNELFMSGGNYPAASPVFPKDFSAAVAAEMAAAR